MIRVLDDKVAVRALDTSTDRSAGGLYLAPSSDNAQIIPGEVVAVGNEMDDYASEDATAIVKVGDTIHFNKFTSHAITSKVDGRLFIVKRSEILAVE